MRKAIIILLLAIPVLVSAQVSSVEDAVADIRSQLPWRIHHPLELYDIHLNGDSLHLYIRSKSNNEDNLQKIATRINKWKKTALRFFLMTRSDHTVAKMFADRRLSHIVHLADSSRQERYTLTIAPEIFQSALNSAIRSVKLAPVIDTSYISKSPYPFTIKAIANLSGSDFQMNGRHEGMETELDLHSDRKVTLSLYAAFRGIGLSLALNPLKMFGQYSDYEFNLNSYSSRYGFDIIYNRTASYSGAASWGDNSGYLEESAMLQKMLTMNGYYAFNYKHFSYPAAFSQSQTQKRSAGSFLLGTSVMIGDFSADENPHYGQYSLKVRQWSLGAGYGYNLVLPHHWLFHLSIVPQTVVIDDNHYHDADGDHRLHLPFPNVILNGRMAVVHDYLKRFYGLSAITNTNGFGRDDEKINNIKWRVRFFYGIRF